MNFSFDSKDVETWRKYLDLYKIKIEDIQDRSKKEKNEFYCKELPEKIKERKGGVFLHSSELVKIVEWKLTRGKWRPRLLNFAKELKDVEVVDATSRAFLAIPDAKAAVTALTELKGIGPATASAVLALFSPSFPFMSDEALEVVLGKREYTLKQYLLLAQRLQEKAKELSTIDSAEGSEWTPVDVENAIWAAKSTSQLQSTLAPGKKRKSRN